MLRLASIQRPHDPDPRQHCRPVRQRSDDYNGRRIKDGPGRHHPMPGPSVVLPPQGIWGTLGSKVQLARNVVPIAPLYLRKGTSPDAPVQKTRDFARARGDPPCSTTTSISTSTAACHSGVSCWRFGRPAMKCPTPLRVLRSPPGRGRFNPVAFASFASTATCSPARRCSKARFGCREFRAYRRR